VRAGPAGLAVGALQERRGIPASTLSHHVAHLVGRGLISQQREGRVLRCTANYQRMNDVIEFLTRECCADAGGCF
jgi:DNA-binding IclR family transcriptional regulator